MPSDSGTVLVFFGAKGGGHSHFHFFKVLKPLPGFSKLLVRDPSGSWYNDGLPGVGGTLEEIAAEIERQLSGLGATRVITAGSSMGGYAAILFGCMLGAERAIAFAPQTLLDPALRHAPPASVRLQVPDLAPVIREAPATEIDLVAGWDDHLDVFNAQRVSGLPSVRVLALHGGVHAFVEDLHRRDELLPMITDLVEGRTPHRCEVDPQLDTDVERRIADTAYAVQSGDWATVAERIAPVAERHLEWAGPNFDLGRALAETGDAEGSEAALARAVRANPRWANAHLQHARCLSSLGRFDEARSAAVRAAELNPDLSEAAERLAG